MQIPADRIHWSRVLPLFLLAAALSVGLYLQRHAPANGSRMSLQILLQALLTFGTMPCRKIDCRQQEALLLAHLARSDGDCSWKEPTR